MGSGFQVEIFLKTMMHLLWIELMKTVTKKRMTTKAKSQEMGLRNHITLGRVQWAQVPLIVRFMIDFSMLCDIVEEGNEIDSELRCDVM